MKPSLRTDPGKPYDASSYVGPAMLAAKLPLPLLD